MIKFDDVSYIYQKKTPYEYLALNQITTEFVEGRYYAIIGKTGSGKSTMIQHLNGLLKATRGTMYFNEMAIDHKTKDKQLKSVRKTVGMVFQFPESQLFEETVEKEVLFGPKNYGKDLDEARHKAIEMLTRLGFDAEQVMQQSPFLLSGGQMRKVALVAILAMNPDILVLDEPTAGLDPKSKRQLMNLFKRLQIEEGKTIILVTHDMNDVAEYAEYVKVMQKGTMSCEMTPSELFCQSEYVRRLHLDIPDIVKLQKDIEQRLNIQFDHLALTEDDFVQMYQDWRAQNEG
ncbi:energy-coupling factor transporter ATPase [Staphylococcus felis]|uniref:Energy-coupling factor transporter ATP-binding protein EcfA2 n=1 Tax=Staphylococcus felis TaxID=46127 RepID=A0ABS0QRW7_9STAP|nr:energy-coupling factor transporter ATPase [Staphylococcus felis]MBH9581622.1 energy-coupling factor transporter ATPase [Staphylococcus felis]MDM8326963.1 energy-coupling factor transporter ATPase [Staphylococcus felis]